MKQKRKISLRRYNEKLTEGNESFRAKINTSLNNVEITKVHRKAIVESESEVEDKNAEIIVVIAEKY